MTRAQFIAEMMEGYDFDLADADRLAQFVDEAGLFDRPLKPDEMTHFLAMHIGNGLLESPSWHRH